MVTTKMLINIDPEIKKEFHKICIDEGIAMKGKISELIMNYVKGKREADSIGLNQ
jgi:hypothetical protein